jgi:thiol-disulfide isomerase/thioredoxin
LIISPPDSFFYNKYSESVNYNDILLKQYLDENNQYTKGKKILCFYGTGCRFCKLATQKMTVIANKLNNKDVINCVFFGSENSVDDFFKETNSIVFQYSFLAPDKFLRITNGEMPLLILLDDGEVKGKYGYRNINENEMIRFIRNELN